MSVNKIEGITISCDNCDDLFESFDGHTIFSMRSDVSFDDKDWHETSDGKIYCNDCHSFDDEGNLIIGYEENLKRKEESNG